MRYTNLWNTLDICQKVRAISGKKSIAYTAAILCDNIPTHLKDLNTLNFTKHLKVYLLSEQ